MSFLRSVRQWLTARQRFSPVGFIAVVLVVVGLLLGTTTHMGFMSLMAAGAFGPGVLRQFGLLSDLDEFQKEATAKSGLRAYLVTGILLMVIVVAENWHHLTLADQVPASTVVILMLVVYYSSYCLSFWDTRKAVSRVLLTFGLLWLAFVVLSHAGEPLSLLGEALVIPGPFILAAILCRWWPRIIGLLLLFASVGSIFFFHMIPLGATDSQEVLRRAFTFLLIPLPLTVAGVALIADSMTPRNGHNRESWKGE
jgi:hypothetical protein